MTPERATLFAKLLAAGVPGDRALRYMAPDAYAALESRARQRWLQDWAASPLVVGAVTTLNGGEWQDLDRDRRLQIALDKHLAELAHFLYTHDYMALVGDERDCADHAADQLMKWLQTSQSEGDSPMRRAVEELLKDVERTMTLGPMGPIAPSSPLPTA